MMQSRKIVRLYEVCLVRKLTELSKPENVLRRLFLALFGGIIDGSEGSRKHLGSWS